MHPQCPCVCSSCCCLKGFVPFGAMKHRLFMTCELQDDKFFSNQDKEDATIDASLLAFSTTWLAYFLAFSRQVRCHLCHYSEGVCRVLSWQGVCRLQIAAFTCNTCISLSEVQTTSQSAVQAV